MKFTRRHLVNLLLVAVIGVVSIAWAAVGLAGIRFTKPKTITVELAQTGGALPGAEVSYLGVPIGKVSSARLTPNSVELKLSVRPKGPMARNLRADVRQKSSLGEPFVNLSPVDPPQQGPRLAASSDPDGMVIPVDRTSSPQPLYNLLGNLNNVLSNMNPADLSGLSQGLTGLVGHEDDIRNGLAAWAQVGDVLGQHHAELGDLLSASAQLTSALDANREQLAGAISGYARLGQTLANHTAELQDILKKGAQFGTVGNSLLTDANAPLKNGLLPGLDTTFHTLATRPQKVLDQMYWVPEFMERVGYVLDGTTMNIGVGNSFPLFPTYQPNMAVPIYGEGLRLDKIFLPTIAQKIELDLSPPQGMQGQAPPMMLRILSPEEAAKAMQSPADLAQVQQYEQQKIQTQGPRETP
ncbi:MAG: MCE family protein [Acidimicrobiia bacterium]|nr:MCE family protein [Acidimicrobiia bacterium]